jgi:hypothetical protein
MVLRLLVEAVGERSGRRLVDDAQHFKTGDLAGVLGGLALGVVEVGRNGDDGLVDGLAEIGFGGFLHLLQDEGRDLGRGVLLAVRLDPGIAVVGLRRSCRAPASCPWRPSGRRTAADQALDGEEVFSGLVTAWRLAGWPTRRSPSSVKATMTGWCARLRRFRSPWAAPFHDGDAGVGGAEVDTDASVLPMPRFISLSCHVPASPFQCG